MTDCCSDPTLSADLSFAHEGHAVEVYTDCLQCGATHKDVFTFAKTEIVD